MWQFFVPAYFGPLHCRRRCTTVRSAPSLAQYHSAHVWHVRLLRRTFPLVRRINQKVPREKKLRMLAGDPPIDWSKVKSSSETILDRDANIAWVMQKEVLSRHRKALMLFGTLHLFHSNDNAPIGLQSAVQRYEKAYPGVTLVIADHMVFANSNDLAKANSNEMEA